MKKETRIIKKTINILQNNQSCEPATVKDNQVRSSNTDEIRVLQEQLSKFEHSVTTKLEMLTMEMQHKLQIQEMNMRHQLEINHLRNELSPRTNYQIEKHTDNYTVPQHANTQYGQSSYIRPPPYPGGNTMHAYVPAINTMPQYGQIQHQHVSQYPFFTSNHQPQLITHPMPPVQQQIHPANITQQPVSTTHHSLVNQQSHSQQIGHKATHMPPNLPSIQQQQLSTAAQQPRDEHTQVPLKPRNQSINHNQQSVPEIYQSRHINHQVTHMTANQPLNQQQQPSLKQTHLPNKKTPSQDTSTHQKDRGGMCQQRKQSSHGS